MNKPENPIKTAYKTICEKAKSNKTRKSLSIINQICLEQLQSGEKNFSVANIGMLSLQKGGPGAQPILNKPGEIYRELINVYAESEKKSKFPANQSSKYSWINGIESQTARWLVRDLISDKSKLIAEVNQLKHDLLNAEVPIQVFSKSASDLDLQNTLTNTATSFTDSEINALKSAVDPNYLEIKGLSIGAFGKIISSDDKVLFKPGFVSAIEKTLDTLSEDS